MAIPETQEEKDAIELINLRYEREALVEENRKLREAMETIASFAPGNGDVCEIIAQRARQALMPNP